MQFTFNEGHIQLPSQWQDQSMQVLVSTDNSGINLVITREAVPQGTLTPELYQETLALYQGKLDGYTEHACREITLAEAPAWLLDYSWNGPEDEGNQGRISQISVLQNFTSALLTGCVIAIHQMIKTSLQLMEKRSGILMIRVAAGERFMSLVRSQQCTVWSSGRSRRIRNPMRSQLFQNFLTCWILKEKSSQPMRWVARKILQRRYKNREVIIYSL